MTSRSTLDEMTEPYRKLIPALRDIILESSAPEQHALDEEQIGQLILERVRELGRMLLQAHLDERHSREQRSLVKGADGRCRGHYQRDKKRQLLSVLGPVEVTRTEMSDPKIAGGLRPLDVELNMPKNLYSFGVLRLIAWYSTGFSFDGVVEAMQRTTGLNLGKRQVEEAVVRCAQDFNLYYQCTAQDAVKDAEVMVLSFDGKGVRMLSSSLRPETRKKAELSPKKLGSRLSPGEKTSRKRMAEVAAVYELHRVPRKVEDILPSREGASKKAPMKAINKRVWASLAKSTKEVIDEAFDEAQGRDPNHEKTWVVLVDGNISQIQSAKAAAKRLSVEVTLIVDLIHVVEYLWKAAWVLYKKGDKNAEAWVRQRIEALLRGKVSRVAAGIRRSATNHNLTKSARAPMDRCCDYILKIKDHLRYDQYLSKGFPIGTGVIEGACRHLVQDRMDLTGARWGLKRAEAILQLRSLYSSKDFDSYWLFHKQQERFRNHLDTYALDEFEDLRHVV